MAMENSTQATTVNPNQQPPVFREQQPSLREIQGLFGNISQNPRSVKVLYGAVGGTQGIPWPNELNHSFRDLGAGAIKAYEAVLAYRTRTAAAGDGAGVDGLGGLGALGSLDRLVVCMLAVMHTVLKRNEALERARGDNQDPALDNVRCNTAALSFALAL